MDQFLILIHEWMGSGVGLAALGCFLWGVVSVLFSPCHLASIPLIVGYVAGQDRLVEGRQAALYAGLFTSGLFLTIAAIGVICALLGRMLGDVGPYWTIAVGLILLWVAMDMLGVATCSMGGSLMGRFKLRGMGGAFVLGLAYGVLSGSCTFGFIAPILAVITVQEKIATGILLIILFGLGHCIPIVIAGSSTALVRRLLDNASWQRGGTAFRRLAGILIGLMGIYFIARPFLPA
ncbi:cytochrome c biogenesis CcdA family protein [Desulfomicrobium baculatum]|uniref:Cytochrome c biogenesis protein transmembrane region n=1 Tax=Desulfomicrobium baculatum (strain DSM 4028 / VKM B-1378 / X) TaxID=525897 RepID=C7LXC9_DESBD|nr:cytochrome c biogenesis protein CcdA [Desulfomicrobium baculatum]ACU90000.1 cytochrome c biogenesis protein transmembrane region [Desulfomicrobium baculatum DSM 4028]